MIPRAEIENDRFELNHEYIECWKWTCPTCGEVNYGPDYGRAEDFYIRHYRDRHDTNT